MTTANAFAPRLVVRAALAALVVLAAGERVSAAEQLLSGKRLLVRERVAGDPGRRRITVLGRASSLAVVGDPVASGAELRVVVVSAGEAFSDQTFGLPASGWRLSAGGYRYVDADGVHGPVKVAGIKASASGGRVKAVVLGRNGPVDIVPPDPGHAGSAVLSITGGDTYCVGFGADAGGVVDPNDGSTFKITSATGVLPCPPAAGFGICELIKVPWCPIFTFTCAPGLKCLPSPDYFGECACT